MSTYKIQSQFINILNEAIQKLALNDKVKIVKQTYMEADGNFTSVLSTEEPFDASKMGSNILVTDEDQVKTEEKQKLINQATDTIKQSLSVSDELQSILDQIKKINEENGSNEWKVNEELNTATLFNKNARIFKQNNKLCLSYNDKVELFDTVEQLHEFLKAHNLPIPQGISIHESVELKETDFGSLNKYLNKHTVNVDGKEMSIGDTTEFSDEQAKELWNSQLKKPRKINKKEYTDIMRMMDKDDVSYVSKKVISPDEKKKEINKEKEKVANLEDKLEQLKAKFNTKKEESMEETNQIDNVWYLKYNNQDNKETFYLNSDWENSNVLTNNVQEAAAFLTADAATREASMVKMIKPTDFDFTPIQEQDITECGVTTGSLGSAVQYTAEKPMEEDKIFGYSPEQKELLKSRKFDAEHRVPLSPTQSHTLYGAGAGIANIRNDVKNKDLSDDDFEKSHNDFKTLNDIKTMKNNWSMQWLGGKDAFRAAREAPDVQIEVSNLTPWLNMWGKATGKGYRVVATAEQLNDFIKTYNEMYASETGEGYLKAKALNPDAKPSPAIEELTPEELANINNFKEEEDVEESANIDLHVLIEAKGLTIPADATDYERAVYEAFIKHVLNNKPAAYWWAENIYKPMIWKYKNKASVSNAAKADVEYASNLKARRAAAAAKQQELAKLRNMEYVDNDKEVKKAYDKVLSVLDKAKSGEAVNAGRKIVDALYAAEDKLADKDKFKGLVNTVLQSAEDKKINLDPRTINMLKTMIAESTYVSKLSKTFYESYTLTEEDSPADFAQGSPIGGAEDITPAGDAGTIDAQAAAADTKGADMGTDTSAAPAQQAGFGDVSVNVNGQDAEYGPEDAEQVNAGIPAVPQEEYRIVDVLVNNDNSSDVKVKVQNTTTGEVEVKDLNEIDV